MSSALTSTAHFLHVANGSCTTDLIGAAGIRGSLSLWADPLHDGPVPGDLTENELLEVRERHHAGPPETDVDPVNSLRGWRSAIERHESYDELILWYEHDLFDQLNLIQLLSWIAERLPATKLVTLICIGSFPNHPRFKGLGELSANELATLLDTRQRVSEKQYSLARSAWQAFRAPAPEKLDALRRTDTAALPYLARAITRFLQEYPWADDGLSRTERRLLALASQGPIALSAAFPRMHDGEHAYYVTDLSLIDLAESLSRTAPPLLTFRSAHAGQNPLQGTVGITDFGRAVLAREQDRVTTCGIDRWFGGVHLQGHSDVWRWDEQRQSITDA